MPINLTWTWATLLARRPDAAQLYVEEMVAAARSGSLGNKDHDTWFNFFFFSPLEFKDHPSLYVVGTLKIEEDVLYIFSGFIPPKEKNQKEILIIYPFYAPLQE